MGNIHVQKVWCAPKPWIAVITHFSRHATLTQLDFILVATRSWFPRELVGRPPWRYESQLSEHLPPNLKPKCRALRKKKIINISPESRKAVSTRFLFPKPGVFELQLLRERFFFPVTPFCRDKVSRSCFTGQLPGMGTVFILASLQMWKVQKASPNTKSTDESGWMGGGVGWGLRGLVGVVRGGH